MTDKKQLTKDEEADEIIRRLSAPPKSRYVINIPYIRNIMPSLIANEIIGVQPMSVPKGLVNITYDEDNDSQTKN